MAFCHNSISLSATAPVLPVELQMIFTIDTFTDLPHHISISIVHGIFTIPLCVRIVVKESKMFCGMV